MRFYFDVRRRIGKRSPMLFGQFLEHFHRCLYPGVCDPASPLSDEQGLRRDVLEAVRKIRPGVVRWPGGCFVSGYHWADGVGPQRPSSFDKAWRVEESNRFGTGEFLNFCRKIDAEPYICCNAGTGSCEEMSDWVEYCNLPRAGKWAKLRAEHGSPDPYGVKYWSIGNENYGDSELGSRSASEWSRLVSRASLMMKRVDPAIELMAPCIEDAEWNLRLLAEAGQRLSWISVHTYPDQLWQEDCPATYEQCMAMTTETEGMLARAEALLTMTGFAGRIRIAVDEWNLRGWHHPHVDTTESDYLSARDRNDLAQTYTMADAVYAACFLNDCLRHCNAVGMANFAPTVNVRGLVATRSDGLLLRPTYHVFDLYANLLGETVLDSWASEGARFAVTAKDGSRRTLQALDCVVTATADGFAVAAVNRHPTDICPLILERAGGSSLQNATLYTLNGPSVDAFNSFDAPKTVAVTKTEYGAMPTELLLAPHSVNLILIEKR